MEDKFRAQSAAAAPLSSTVRPSHMSRYFALIFLALASLVWAGDEFLTPKLSATGSFESADPKYRSVGMEIRADANTLFVVADTQDVLTQRSLNRIIRDAQRRSPDLTEIHFYTSVHDKPVNPSFAIYDHIAVYVRSDNKTYYGVAAKKLYGGWAYGPNG